MFVPSFQRFFGNEPSPVLRRRLGNLLLGRDEFASRLQPFAPCVEASSRDSPSAVVTCRVQLPTRDREVDLLRENACFFHRLTDAEKFGFHVSCRPPCHVIAKCNGTMCDARIAWQSVKTVETCFTVGKRLGGFVSSENSVAGVYGKIGAEFGLCFLNDIFYRPSSVFLCNNERNEFYAMARSAAAASDAPLHLLNKVWAQP